MNQQHQQQGGQQAGQPLQQQQLIQQGQQQAEEEEEEEGDDAVDPLAMTETMFYACQDGDVGTISRRLDAGENVNGLDATGGTPVTVALAGGQYIASKMLVARGADLSIVDYDGANALHCAALGGDLDCIKWVFAKTTIDVNSTHIKGSTSLGIALAFDQLVAAKYFVEKGANLFMKNIEGIRVIDIHIHCDQNREALGPQVLQHALDLRWSSVKHLLLVANSLSTDPEFALPETSTTYFYSKYVNLPQRPASSVFANLDLVRTIANFMLRKEIIVRDPAVKRKTDVKRRVEAALAGLNVSE
jgi:hypothetical protein